MFPERCNENYTLHRVTFYGHHTALDDSSTRQINILPLIELEISTTVVAAPNMYCSNFGDKSSNFTRTRERQCSHADIMIHIIALCMKHGEAFYGRHTALKDSYYCDFAKRQLFCLW